MALYAVRNHVLNFAIFLVLAIAGQVRAAETPAFDDLRWLDPNADRVTALTRAVPEPLKLKGLDADQRFLVELGRIAFRAPDTLGGLAARWGVSCQTCHINGGRNASFFIEGLSGAPGTFDTTNAVFNTRTQDHAADPLPIPVLYDVANTAPYAHDGRYGRLEDMVTHVIEDEFTGATPEPIVFLGLLNYLSALGTPSGEETMKLDFGNAYRDVARGTKTLETALKIEDARLVDFIVQALRRDLGRMAARFPGEDDTLSLLAEMSAGLRDIARDAQGGDFNLARVSLASFERALDKAEGKLARRAPHSLYNPDVLRAALKALDAPQ
jgi:cytochrome c peroxidase